MSAAPGRAPLRAGSVPRWQRLWLDLSAWGLGLSGVAWLVLHYARGAGADDGTWLPHPAEAWLMRLHGLAGFALLLAVGMFLPLHVPQGWRQQRGHLGSGVAG